MRAYQDRYLVFSRDPSSNSQEDSCSGQNYNTNTYTPRRGMTS